MSDSKKINVMLYGDGSRNARLRKETVYCDIPNYVGKWAKVNSINRDIPISDGKSTYMFDGDELVGDFSSAFLPFNASTAHVRIPITPDMRVKITDNKQVKEDTVFV